MRSIPSGLSDLTEQVLGLHVDPAALTFAQMAVRSAVVFIFGICLVRLGDRRLLGKNAGFDVLLVIVLGSVLSRAVNGHAAFFPTLGACVVLVLLHHVLGSLASRSDRVSRWLKGSAHMLIVEGRIDRAALRRCNMSLEDLDENLRLNGNVSIADWVKEGRLERNGLVSVVKNPTSE